MRQYITSLLFFALVCTSCDVHEFPSGRQVPLYTVQLEFDTEFVQQEYPYTKVEDHTGNYDMRYTIRAFPVIKTSLSTTVSKEYAWEHTFTSNVQYGNYNAAREIEMDLPDGDYVLHVWSDFVKAGTADHHFYNPNNMGEITLHAEHKGNTDMRDAFRGTLNFRAAKDTTAQGRQLLVKMERPLAKFEFRATDLKEFVEREYAKTKQGDAVSPSQADSIIQQAIQNYTVRFSYSGFMPCAFDMFSDKPNDAKTGVTFETVLTRLGNEEISMGFDYVYVNGSESNVRIVMAMYSREGEEIFETNPITILVKRGQHSIMRGPFLTIDTKGGVGIDPDFDGEFNYEVKY